MDPQELGVVRRAYAKQILAVMDIHDDRVEAGFATVPREAYLGPGPWPILRYGTAVPSPSADAVYLYTDDLVAIDPARKLNNGQPSFHACLMAAAAPRPGQHAVQIGAGLGYYTAILAELVGPSGRVTAFELEPDLAGRARANLAAYPHVETVTGDGTSATFAPADVIYVNAGVTRPAEHWLDGLKDGGRLILPLTISHPVHSLAPVDIRRHGVVFLITRHGADFLARRVSAVAIYPCGSLRDEASEDALRAALARDDGGHVTRLHRREGRSDESVWLRGTGWCLTTG